MEEVAKIADTLAKVLAPLSIALSAWLGWLVYKATTRAPIDAARVAAELSREAGRQSEIERRRMYVFATLMGARRAVYTREVVAAFNVIDVIFHDCRNVREAWADLYSAYHDDRLSTPPGGAAREEKLKLLLFEMAKVLEIGPDLRVEDINRAYLPESLGRQGLLEMLQTDRLLSDLQSTASANTALRPPRQDG